MRTLLCSVMIVLLSAAGSGAVFAGAGGIAPRDGATPVTNVSPTAPTTEERRADLLAGINELLKERANLLSANGDPASDAFALQRQQAAAISKKIEKMRSELLQLPTGQ